MIDRELLNVRGRVERAFGTSRLDIDFETENGLVIVECKASSLTNRHLSQLCRYLAELALRKFTVCRAYLIGLPPAASLAPEMLEKNPLVILKLLYRDLPSYLALCEGRHYYDFYLDACPFCGAPGIPGHEFQLRL